MERWMLPRAKVRIKKGLVSTWFADKDRDGVSNIFDCKPNNRRRQGKLVQNIPLAKAKYMTLYHGTNVPRAQKIMKVGMRPHTLPLSGGMRSIHFTPHIGTALEHAAMGPVIKITDPENAPPALLKVTLPVKQIKKGYGETDPVLLLDEYEHIRTTPVPPRYIKQLDIKKITSKAIRKIIQEEMKSGSDDQYIREEVSEIIGNIKKSQAEGVTANRQHTFHSPKFPSDKRIITHTLGEEHPQALQDLPEVEPETKEETKESANLPESTEDILKK